jgi:hypothetical protein
MGKRGPLPLSAYGWVGQPLPVGRCAHNSTHWDYLGVDRVPGLSLSVRGTFVLLANLNTLRYSSLVVKSAGGCEALGSQSGPQ